jgi:hypothetical protein
MFEDNWFWKLYLFPLTALSWLLTPFWNWQDRKDEERVRRHFSAYRRDQEAGAIGTVACCDPKYPGRPCYWPQTDCFVNGPGA